jgi:gliding motility-associated protein GldE
LVDSSSFFYALGLFFLVLVSAFSSASETALTSISRIKVKHLAEEEVVAAKYLEELLEHPNRFLATILFINNLVNIGAASLATVLAANYFRHFAAGIATGITTIIILIYGEITPKSFAVQNAERIALLVAKPIRIACRVLFPVVRIFISISNFFIKILGGKTLKEGPFITEEEIKTIVSVGEEEGVIEEEEREMIHSIFEFGDTITREVMVPRTDMVCVEGNMSLQEVLGLIMLEGHSRIPVYEESVDNILGIVYAKDLLSYLNEGKFNVSLKDLMRQAYFIPETKKVSDLLRELRKKKIHIAIVVDEYGGTAGLVTIEDLLEEIVGEIFDEYDLEETMIETIDENTVLVDARVGIDEINELLAVSLPDCECDTIGGFVFNLFGKVPIEGEKIKFEQLNFTIQKIGGRRIQKILISKEKQEDEK